jgi:hypothetical protein
LRKRHFEKEEKPKWEGHIRESSRERKTLGKKRTLIFQLLQASRN